MHSRFLSCAVLASMLWLAACGGGGGAPVDAESAPTIGAAGGSVALPGGASVTVPAGALTTAVTIRVAMDAAGAPALPAGLTAAGSIYAITPHGSEFERSVEVRVPVPAAALQPNEQLKLAKAQPGGSWLVLDDSRLQDGQLVASVSSFSYYVPVRLRYDAPLTQLPPFAITSQTLDCGEQDCQDLVGVPSVTYRVSTNSGAFPADCPSPRVQLFAGRSILPDNTGMTDMPLAGGSISTTLALAYPYYNFGVMLRCGPVSFSWLGGRGVQFRRQPIYPALSVLAMPQGVEVVEGRIASVNAVLAGGASKVLTKTTEPSPQTEPAPLTFAAPTETDRATIDWERSDDGGGSWRVVARSYQNEASPLALGASQPWRYWSVRHSFVAGAADQGAMLRVRACYTPPNGAPPPCVTGPVSHLNVLQQSALPALSSQPRSVLVRSGQTASFSATAGGAPTPALQWQTRPANATGAWSDVTTGSGADSGNYTTAVLTLADNGRQFRLVASNAAGSAESLPVTVSVSDADVAPTLLAQPSALTVAAGGEAVFAVDARGTEALSYQWRKDGAPLAGAHSAVLRLAAVSAASAGDYSVVVSNVAGSVASASAALGVGPAGGAAALAPSIVTPPLAVTIGSGNTATFGIGVAGTGPFSYQWRKDGRAIAGATAAVYSLAAATTADQGAYSVAVSNSVGSAVSPAAVLSVNTPSTPAVVAPSITTPPAALVVMPGGPATLAVAAVGSGPLGYQWSKDGSVIAGANGPVLHFAGVSGGDAGSYAVAVSNAAGSVTSTAATLIVVGAPLVTGQPAAQTAQVGASATFSVAASGNNLRYQWTRNNVAIAGATSASVTTPALVLGDNGAVYGVVVYNAAGVAFSQSAVLSVTVASLAQTMQASLTSAGAMPDNISYRPSLSADGSRVAFISNGSNLIPGTAIGGHAYLRDRVGNTTTRLTVRPDGSESSQGTSFVKIAANGRHVVFRSRANDLVAGDSNTADDVFVRDLVAQTTVRVNVLADGSQDMVSAGTTGLGADISADGRRVLMRAAANLAGDGAATAGYRWYLRDLDAGVTRWVTGSEDGQAAALSPDGRYAVFIVVAGSGASSQARLMLYDDQAGSTSQLLAVPSGTWPEGMAGPLAVSDGAAAIAFWLRSSSVGGGGAAYSQIGVLERGSGSLTIASVTDGGVAGNGHSGDPSLSRDGRYVSFRSAASNLSGDPASAVGSYLLVRDRQAGTTRIASRRPDGTPFLSQQGYNENALSADGSVVVHLADAGEVVPGATGGAQVYLSPRP